METCYILFGSNKGDKKGIFDLACLYINNRCGQVLQVSSPYESEPWGFETEEWFLNRMIVITTRMNPEDLLGQLLEIERELGRERHPEGPRRKTGRPEAAILKRIVTLRK